MSKAKSKINIENLSSEQRMDIALQLFQSIHSTQLLDLFSIIHLSKSMAQKQLTKDFLFPFIEKNSWIYPEPGFTSTFQKTDKESDKKALKGDIPRSERVRKAMEIADRDLEKYSESGSKDLNDFELQTQSKESKPISIRFNIELLKDIQKLAKQKGFDNYQTFIKVELKKICRQQLQPSSIKNTR